jgi:hypothetical protein
LRERRTRDKTGLSIPRRLMPKLEKTVDRFASLIQRRYPALMTKRARPTKQLILSWLNRKLPPFPRRPGRPEKEEVTKAAKMLTEQKREIRQHRRKLVDWDEIAAACIPGWADMRDRRRKRERGRLRNSVGVRNARRSKSPPPPTP